MRWALGAAELPPTVRADPVPRQMPPASTEGTVDGKHSMTSITTNVRSLDPGKLRQAHRFGLSTNARIEYLDHMFNQYGADVVFVQETALQGRVERQQANYLAYNSGASAGGLCGVAIWVANALVDAARVKATPIHERLMFVNCDMGTCKMKLTTGHSHIEAASQVARSAFLV